MPDAHWGNGTSVGTVIPTKGAIIPAAVGVDIGCGMVAVRLDLTANDLPDNLQELRSMIEAAVPHGRTDNGGVNDRGAWGSDAPPVEVIGDKMGKWAQLQSLSELLKVIYTKHPKIEKAANRWMNHMGTLGGGNHFIELCLDENQDVWVMLHSGSRGIGNRIGSHFIEKAKEEMARWYVNLPDKDLSYLVEGSQYFNDYIQALEWAQEYAALNRSVMLFLVLECIEQFFGKPIKRTLEAVNCHHNYVSQEKHFGQNVFVTRKGAVRITPEVLGIIPGSMGAKSYIVRGKEGKEAAESLCSCSHGAGRAMSRTEAKKKFSLEDHRAAMVGVECRIDEEVIDETPMAYKDIDMVMKSQEDHVEIVHTLKQVLCVKG